MSKTASDLNMTIAPQPVVIPDLEPTPGVPLQAEYPQYGTATTNYNAPPQYAPSPAHDPREPTRAPQSAPRATPAPTVMVPGEQMTTWESGLCACFSDLGSCCETAFMHYCQAGAQHGRFHTGVPGMRFLPCVGMMMGDLLCLGLATPFMACHLRGLLRNRYNIAGDKGTDCAVSLLCAQCVLCQNYREMCVRGEHPGGVCCTTMPYRPGVRME